MTPQVFPLANGAQLGYEILGADHLKRGVRPIVLINGMSGRYEDWETLSIPLSKLRPGGLLIFSNGVWLALICCISIGIRSSVWM
ncbi:uncharacterized protein EI90DRAFT_3080963, partial [Cantharellus anzutake]|uniref:uncharacterized protein n=1 Tax=Cantharellus anzutake TaxID=1750568 RepID=UPI0019063F03